MGDWYKIQEHLNRSGSSQKLLFHCQKCVPQPPPLKQTRKMYMNLKNCLDHCQKKPEISQNTENFHPCSLSNSNQASTYWTITVHHLFYLHNLLLINFFYSLICTYYTHSVLVHDFVSSQDCFVNQYHYELWQRSVVMRLIHTTGLARYKVLYQ